MNERENSIFKTFFKVSQKNYLHDLQKGLLYMKRLQYYIDLENNSSNHSMGDGQEAQEIIYNVDTTLSDCNDNKEIGTFKVNKMTIDLGYKDNPVFCLATLDERNIISDSSTQINFGFSEEQIKEFKNFGDSVLLITNPTEFLNRIEKAFNRLNLQFYYDKVSYSIENDSRKLNDIFSPSSYYRIAFWKRKEYECQQEFRIMPKLKITNPDYFWLEIGDISDISKIIPFDIFFNYKICQDFISNKISFIEAV